MMHNEPFTPGPHPAPVHKLYRSTTERQVAGVCGGLAEYLHTDPTVVRVTFVVLAVVGGAGVLLYPLLWLIIPEAPPVWMQPEEQPPPPATAPPTSAYPPAP